jgi:linoleoyl-CoA desaturase
VTDRYWYIGNRAYDLTDWIGRHPGGRDALLQAEGTDCTELFRSYHLRGEPPAKLLARYEVQVDATDPRHAEAMRGSHFTFAEGAFYKTVQGRVRAYFADGGLSTHASRWAQLYALTTVVLAVGLTYPAFVMGSVGAAVALSVLKAVAAIGPGHSMSHFCLFPRGRWNTLVLRVGSAFLVSNPAIWSASHVQSHHVDTLTRTDMQDHYPLKRIQPALPHRPWHRVQHLYTWIIYLLGLPLWALQDFARSALSLFTGDHATVKFTFAQRVENTVMIGLNLVVTVALPFFFLDWRRALLVCLLVNVPSSFFLVIQIAVNHEVPDTMNKVVTGAPIDWGVHQVLTSHNFAVDSFAALHFSGGLNMQIEHHLFPSVHYSHYPALARIVKQACEEFDLPYNTSCSLWEAMVKHYRVLQMNSVP